MWPGTGSAFCFILSCSPGASCGGGTGPPLSGSRAAAGWSSRRDGGGTDGSSQELCDGRRMPDAWPAIQSAKRYAPAAGESQARAWRQRLAASWGRRGRVKPPEREGETGQAICRCPRRRTGWRAKKVAHRGQGWAVCVFVYSHCRRAPGDVPSPAGPRARSPVGGHVRRHTRRATPRRAITMITSAPWVAA